MDAISAVVERVVRSGRYVGGPEVENFERELAHATGTDYAVGVSNGLDALRLIFKAYIEMGRLKPGDEVIIPPTLTSHLSSLSPMPDSCGVLRSPTPRRSTSIRRASSTSSLLAPEQSW